MDYIQALEYIHRISWSGSRPGLERIRELCSRLGNPQNRLKFVHVAGTNGKGSFCAMLESILRYSGYKTGLYTSPYVKYFNERMAVNGKMISNEKLAQAVTRVSAHAEQMADAPTEFELICAVAFEYFASEGCDVVILEVGLGGRLDATNVIESSLLSVITGIALDHMELLGDTIPKIAKEKAGIIKEGTPVLFGGEDEDAARVIREAAQENNSAYYEVDRRSLAPKEMTVDGTLFDYKSFCDLKLSLLGSYQPYNAATVLDAVELLRTLGLEIPDDAVYSGLSTVVWHARFEVISRDPLVIFDGGHNPEGIDAAMDSVKTYFGREKVNVLTAVMADKDYDYISKKIAEVASRVYTVRADNPRALGAEDYAAAIRRCGVEAIPCESVDEGVRRLIQSAKDEKKAALICGSLYLYEQVSRVVELTCP